MPFLRAVAQTRCTSFAVVNLAISPIGLAIYGLCMSMGVPTPLAFTVMTSATTPFSYWAIRQKSFDSDQLHWRRNLHRWALQRTAMFFLGQYILWQLTSIGVSELLAVVLNGALQFPLSYLLSVWWSFAEVKEAKA